MINTSTAAIQRQVCSRYSTGCVPPKDGSKVGIALNVRENIVPLNGLRHPPIGDTNGWYIWSGEVLSSEDDFFKPLHIEHISDWCPQAVKFLALPPGWRFLIAGEYEDVWFDEALLKIE